MKGSNDSILVYQKFQRQTLCPNQGIHMVVPQQMIYIHIKNNNGVNFTSDPCLKSVLHIHAHIIWPNHFFQTVNFIVCTPITFFSCGTQPYFNRHFTNSISIWVIWKAFFFRKEEPVLIKSKTSKHSQFKNKTFTNSSPLINGLLFYKKEPKLC